MAQEWANAQDDNGSIGSSDQQEQETHVYDHVIIGAGMIGIFALSEGIRRGATNICLLESKSRPGGLWATLPKWQTVQNAVMDFCIEGFTSKKKVWAADDVLHFVDEYIKAAKLDPYINYGRYVSGYEWSEAEEVWTLRAKRHKVVDGTTTEVEEVYRCRQLLMCTGKHAAPKIPHIPHNDGSVPVLHNTQIDSFEQFKGKKVVVMGAGASALDLLINTLKTNVDAKPSERGHFVHWLVREPKYFSAQNWNDLFPVTVMQLLFGRWGIHICSWFTNVFAHVAFFLYGVHSWLPKDHAFDFERDQIVPNRGYVLTQKKRIKRVDGAVEVVEIKDRSVRLRGGEVIEDVDALLMGTGFTAPVHDPALGLTDKTEFFMKITPLGKLQGKLFLLGETLLDASAATPTSMHALAQYSWNLVQHADHFKLQNQSEGIIPRGRLINHIELLNYPMDYRGDDMKPFVLWRFRVLATLIYYRLRYNTSVYFSQKLLGVNMHLD